MSYLKPCCIRSKHIMGIRREFYKHVTVRSRCIIKPRVAIVFVLFFVWHSYNNSISTTSAKSQPQKYLRLRAPPPAAPSQLMKKMDDEIHSSEFDLKEPQPNNEFEFINPFVGFGNGNELMNETIRKKKNNCGVSAIAARNFIGPSMKRTYFANTREEMDQKVEEETRQKRNVENLIKKRNDINEGPLPWTCLTKYDWEDMGADHYPRFVRTAECKSRVCFNGFFRCKPRRYKTKVLKRISTTDSTSCEEDDVSLPESLRNSWRFITVTINLCCDCTGRIPGTDQA